jgi:UDP-3-O-[3-hydroxymyristoyl] glucosamine N-acyltransferase
MKVTAAQLAQMLDGTLEGDPNATVTRPARIESAGEGDFAFLDGAKYESYAYTTAASVLLVHIDFKPTAPVRSTLIRVSDVRGCLSLLLEKFAGQSPNGAAGTISDRAYVHPQAHIGVGVTIGAFVVVEEGAVIGDHCTIYPQVFIGRNARIGDGTVLHPGVRVHFDCIIGSSCILHANAVIGSDGFGFVPQPDQSWKKVPHVGNVVLEENVEIGACTCIDRASMGSTLIRRGAKIDNLVHVAHNVEVGRNTAMAAQVGVAGSSKIGDNVQLGGQTGIAGHLTLAEGTKTQAQSGMASSVEEPGKSFFGSPAIPYNNYLRSYIVFKQLPELQKRLHDLEKKLAALTPAQPVVAEQPTP